MLYTASTSVAMKTKGKMRLYFLSTGHGNDVVVPNHLDFEHFKSGELTWKGFKANYLAKLMRPEAEQWMGRVAAEAERENVVLVSEEENSESCCRRLLADIMLNMFSGQMNLRYMGELPESQN